MISKSFIALLAIANAAPFRGDSYESGQLEKRFDNGLGKTPALGWNGWVRLPVLSAVVAHHLSVKLDRTRDSATQQQPPRR
jgi:hypothetical protein